MVEPDYYIKNGLSPLQAFEQGLMSKEEFVGFCKGNVIKYTVRAGSKDDDPLMDIIKAMDYLRWLHKALKGYPIEDSINEEEVLTYPEDVLMGMDGSKKRTFPETKIPVNGQKYEASELQGNLFTRTFNKLKNKKEEY